MAEDTQKAQTPVTETQEPVMPAGQEQKTPEPTNEVKDGLPEEASERTKTEFEKLQNQLREERQKRESVESAFKALSQPKPSVPEPIYDPNTGLIDGQQLTDLQKTTIEAKREAEEAKAETLRLRREREYDQAYKDHPWTDPKSKDFDQKRSDFAAAIALASMVNPEKYGGKQLDLEGAAKFVESLNFAEVKKAQEDATKVAAEQLGTKEQASLEATGSSGRVNEQVDDLEDLRQASRKGNTPDANRALMERLRRLKTQAQS